MRMKCIYCNQEMKIYEQYCPACGELVIEGDPEFFEELKEKSKIINSKTVGIMLNRPAKKRSIFSRIQRFWLFNELNK